MPIDSLTVDKIGALPDDRFQELLTDGTIHPKMKRGAMAMHAAHDSLERDLASGGTRSLPAQDRDLAGRPRNIGLTVVVPSEPIPSPLR